MCQKYMSVHTFVELSCTGIAYRCIDEQANEQTDPMLDRQTEQLMLINRICVIVRISLRFQFDFFDDDRTDGLILGFPVKRTNRCCVCRILNKISFRPHPILWAKNCRLEVAVSFYGQRTLGLVMFIMLSEWVRASCKYFSHKPTTKSRPFAAEHFRVYVLATYNSHSMLIMMMSNMSLMTFLESNDQ